MSSRLPEPDLNLLKPNIPSAQSVAARRQIVVWLAIASFSLVLLCGGLFAQSKVRTLAGRLDERKAYKESLSAEVAAIQRQIRGISPEVLDARKKLQAREQWYPFVKKIRGSLPTGANLSTIWVKPDGTVELVGWAQEPTTCSDYIEQLRRDFDKVGIRSATSYYQDGSYNFRILLEMK